MTSTNLDLGISRAREMLQSAANIQVVSASVTDGILEARVKVENNSGHKAPTAFPSRRMWLHFLVTDSNNNVVFESGRINADGSIVGVDNDVDQSVYEPHYDQITAADQVQVYETIMGDSDGNVTYTLLRAAQYLKDNRVTPKGFDKFNVPADVAVHGQAFNDSNFNTGSDEVVYRVPVGVAGDLNVSVSLNYQTIAHGVLQDLYRDNQLQQVQDFRAMYDSQSLKHEQITSVQTTVVSDGGGTAPVPTASLSVSPSTIEQGDSAILSWDSSNANSCTASGAWSGNRNTNGSETVTPTVTSTYTLSCNGDGGSASDSVTLTVNESPSVNEPTVSMTASPSSVARGGSITITWSSTDADSCTASGNWSGSRTTSGSEAIVLNDPATFTLTCSGDGGMTSDSISYRARGRRWLDLQ